jgi:signal transduction histidine kinase
MTRIFFHLIILFFFANISYSQLSNNGELDLRFSSEKIYSLNGKLLYYNKQFLVRESKNSLIEILSARAENGGNSPSSYGSYRLKVLNPDSMMVYGLFVKGASSSYRFFLNGQLVYQFGKRSKTEKEYLVDKDNVIIPLSLKKVNDLVFEVTNFTHLDTGFLETIKLGPINQLYNERNKSIAKEFFYFGSFLIIGLFLILIFLFRYEHKYLIMLGISCLLLSFRMIITELNYFTFFSFFINNKLNIASYYLLLYMFFLYFKFILKDSINKKPFLIITSVTIAFLLFLLIFNNPTDFNMILWFTMIMLIGFIYILYLSYQSLKAKNDWGLETLISVSSLFSILSYDLFTNDSPNLLSLNTAEFLLCFVLFNIVIISKKYATTYEVNQEYLENQKKIAFDNENIANEISILNDVLQDMNYELEAKVQERSLELIIKNKQLQVANEKSEQANRSKTIFFSFMTHELRTPINAVLGYSDLLKEDMKEDQETKYIDDVEKIFEAGMHLLEVVNNLLDFAKLESGKMLITAEKFSSESFVNEIKNAIHPLALKNKNEFLIEHNITSPEFHNDRLKMKIVLINLLSNSCKFTKEGQIKLIITETDKRLQFEVIDTGMGMTERQQGNLFKEFSQADGNISKNFGGSGLGLMITKKYCELLMGGISVKSAYGEGTTFKVLIKKEMQSTESDISPL